MFSGQEGAEAREARNMAGAATIGHQHLTGDVAGRIRNEESHDLGNVLGLAELISQGFILDRPAQGRGKASRRAGVMVMPGATALQRMPALPWLAAMARVNWMIAALDEE